MGACDQCYRTKLRCSGSRPICDRCSQRRSLCTYTSNRPLGRPKRGRRTLSDSGYVSLGIRDDFVNSVHDVSRNQDQQVLLEYTPSTLLPGSVTSPRASTSRLQKGLEPQHDSQDFEDNVHAIGIRDADGANAYEIDSDLDIFLHSLDSAPTGFYGHQSAPEPTNDDVRLERQGLTSDAYPSTCSIKRPTAFVALENESNASTSVTSHCSRAAELISGLSTISNSNTADTFQSSLQLAQKSIDFVMRVTRWNSTNDNGLQAVLVIATLCHVIMRLALKTYSQLRLQIAQSKDSENLSDHNDTDHSEKPLMLGIVEIRSVQARWQVFEALIEAEGARAEKVVEFMKEHFKAWGEKNDTEADIAAIWACLLD